MNLSDFTIIGPQGQKNYILYKNYDNTWNKGIRSNQNVQIGPKGPNEQQNKQCHKIEDADTKHNKKFYILFFLLGFSTGITCTFLKSKLIKRK